MSSTALYRYEGLCITGPWDGKVVAREMPNFTVALWEPLELPLEFPELPEKDWEAHRYVREFCYYYARIANAGFWTPHGWTDPNVMVALCQRYVSNANKE